MSRAVGPILTSSLEMAADGTHLGRRLLRARGTAPFTLGVRSNARALFPSSTPVFPASATGSPLSVAQTGASTSPPACPVGLTARSCGSGLTSGSTSRCVEGRELASALCIRTRRANCSRPVSSPLSDEVGCRADAAPGAFPEREPGGLHASWLGEMMARTRSVSLCVARLSDGCGIAWAVVADC